MEDQVEGQKKVQAIAALAGMVRSTAAELDENIISTSTALQPINSKWSPEELVKRELTAVAPPQGHPPPPPVVRCVQQVVTRLFSPRPSLSFELARRYEIGWKIVLKTGDASLVATTHAPPLLHGARARERRGAKLQIFADCALARRVAPESAKNCRQVPKHC